MDKLLRLNYLRAIVKDLQKSVVSIEKVNGENIIEFVR